MIRLLIIEDELLMLDHLSKIIDWESLGYSIVGLLSNGEAAKKYIDENPVDVILSDIELPIMTGTELAKYVFENHPEIKIVFISAYRNFNYALEAIQYKVLNYITKPIVYEKFLKVMIDTANLFCEDSLLDDSISDDSHVEKVIKYIKENYNKKISLASAAEYIHLNASYLSRTFKKETGENFSDYLNNYRISMAEKCLLTSGKSTVQIAIDVGFSDVHYFYKLFKKKTGITIQDYKRNKQLQ